ncbi:MAG: hypothetical protein PUB21_04695 [Bacteroidales bacterium]|nr:hypothetical protein [Bacteroidales bacterium]
MKKILLLTASLFFASNIFSQINYSGSFTGIDIPVPQTLAHPESAFKVFQPKRLPAQLDSCTAIATFSGEANTQSTQYNRVKNTLWLRRAKAGNDWQTATLHDGVSVDNSFLIPGKETKTWWERDPKNDVQSWGTAANTYMTIKGGNVGIGTAAPGEKLVLYNGTALQTATQYANASTAIGTDKGFMVGIESAGNGLIWHRNNSFIRFGTNATEHMRILGNGNIGIGKLTPQYKLDVNGVIHAKEVVLTETNGADFVFDKDYCLPDLQSVEEHIKEHRHLPEIPSADDMKKNGVGIVELNIKLLQKIEELTLYIIDQEKKLSSQNERILTLEQALGKE